ncbi:Protein ELF4-LIKE 1 [Cardamine amara subsp. amara]|uniref:Protein ELF4-LIKE 1 n=1 Tax=Cardamine amara subsp. amara TaxID=228776 RepID=A0ABD0ZMB6_CARAN
MEEASKRRSIIGNNRALEMNDDVANEEFNNVEVWDTLSNGFKRAQIVLDQNRELIQRVNDNHRSRIPDNVARNVDLINEINGNISTVMEIYSDLSVNFTKNFDERRRTDKISDTTTTTGSYGGGRSSCGS